MTDDLALARRAVACRQWRWLPGMLRLSGAPPEMRREGRVSDLRDYWSYVARPVLPDLTDPATLGCLLALVREFHGPSTVARHVGTNGKGGKEWAICDRSPMVNGWHLAAPDLGYWTSEAEALVAALENAP